MWGGETLIEGLCRALDSEHEGCLSVLRYGNTLDVTLTLNGIPVATAELKKPEIFLIDVTLSWSMRRTAPREAKPPPGKKGRLQARPPAEHQFRKVVRAPVERGV